MPPVDAVAESKRREDLLTRVAAGESLASVGISAPTYSRWKREYDKLGLKGLEPKFSKCGRKPMAQLDDWEKATAKELYLKTESVTTALRMLADLPECSADTAAAIERGANGRPRHSKHSIPRNLRQAIKVPEAVLDYHKSPKQTRLNHFLNPRTLTYLTPSGEKPLLVGDLSERDDMSNNYVGWVDWPWGGDPCSDRFGVRIARGQSLTQIDVRSCYFQSFCFLIRLRDSYRADDIWAWIGHTYRDIFVPAIGERLERGIWKSNKIRGIDPGHTSDDVRIGGITALGRRVIESQSPTTKIIENRFNFLQTVSGTIPGQIGRKRGEMERETKLWMECRAGRRDPREHFLSMTEICNQMEAKMTYVNSEPMEGRLYHGVPAEIYARGLEERADVLKPLAPEQAYVFSRDLRETHIKKSHAMVRYTHPDGRPDAWFFHHPDLWRYGGEPVAVFMDRHCAGEGATLVFTRPGLKVPPMQAELIDGIPQFVVGVERDQRMDDALARRKAQMDAVRSEYRAIGITRRIARVSNVQDGAGGSATVKQSTERRGSQTLSEAGSIPARSAFSSPVDPEHLRRLEERFREDHPDHAIT